jgi:diguanylate cyclase (GGDEF)-like protein/PAS domain S-box-containing protein
VDDQHKTKGQLIRELAQLRERATGLEDAEAARIRAEALADGARRYAEDIVETVRQPLLVLDADMNVVSANRAFYDTFQVTPSGTLGTCVYALGNHQWDIPRLRTLLEDILPRSSRFDSFEVAHDFERLGRKVMLLNARRIHHHEIGQQTILLAIEDVTERKRMEERLLAVSVTDELTGLYNRRGLFALADKVLKLAKRQGKGVFLLYVDLDGLKVINDALGHEEGDRALVDTANMLRSNYRESDIIARIGGDEFVVIPVGTTGDSTEAILSRLQEAVAVHRSENHRRYELSLSAGVAYHAPEAPGSVGELLVQGDKSMYEQKRDKRGP